MNDNVCLSSKSSQMAGLVDSKIKRKLSISIELFTTLSAEEIVLFSPSPSHPNNRPIKNVTQFSKSNIFSY